MKAVFPSSNSVSWTTIPLDEGSTAQDVVDKVFAFFDKKNIPREHIVSITTDGCSTMLGQLNGMVFYELFLFLAIVPIFCYMIKLKIVKR